MVASPTYRITWSQYSYWCATLSGACVCGATSVVHTSVSEGRANQQRLHSRWRTYKYSVSK